MSEMHGQVLAVTAVTIGSVLAQDAAAGDLTLYVEDAADFDEGGGTLDLNGTQATYTAVDLDAETLTLAAGLGAAASAGDPVAVWDAEKQADAVELRATVVVDGDDTNTDPIEAIVNHSLQPLLPEGIRSAPAESVALVLDGTQWYVTNVLGAESVIDGTQLDADTQAQIAAGASGGSDPLAALITPSSALYNGGNLPASANVGDAYIDSTPTPYICTTAYPSGGSLAVNWTEVTVSSTKALVFGLAFTTTHLTTQINGLDTTLATTAPTGTPAADGSRWVEMTAIPAGPVTGEWIGQGGAWVAQSPDASFITNLSAAVVSAVLANFTLLTATSIETDTAADRGVKITSNGITAYNSSGGVTFNVDDSTGRISTQTGTVRRLELGSNITNQYDPANIAFWQGDATDTYPGVVGPYDSGSQPSLAIIAPANTANPNRPQIDLISSPSGVSGTVAVHNAGLAVDEYLAAAGAIQIEDHFYYPGGMTLASTTSPTVVSGPSGVSWQHWKNTGCWTDMGNGATTCQVAGTYMLTGAYDMTTPSGSNAGRVIAYFLKNGSTQLQPRSITPFAASENYPVGESLGPVIVSLSVGDTIALGLSQNSGGSSTVNPCAFSIRRLV